MTMTLFFLVLGANFVVDQYGRAVLRDAVDEAARAGAVYGAAPDACQQRARQVLSNAMAGKLGQSMAVSCQVVGDNVVATGTASFPGWLPAMPAWSMTVSGEAHVEGTS